MGSLSQTLTHVHFDPLLSSFWLGLVCIIAVILLALSLWKNKNAIVLRFICIALFITALFNPSLLQKEREPTRDVGLLVVDQSASQKMGQRSARTENAFAHLQADIAKHANLELRVVNAPRDGAFSNETRLFDAIERAFADVPAQRRAGIVFLSDGQIHDVPKHEDTFSQYGPVHVLLTGEKNEKDRRIEIIEAPSYGIVGDTVRITYKVIDTDNINKNTAMVTVDDFGTTPPQTYFVPIGEEHTVELDLKHAGDNIFQLYAEDVSDEITTANNRAALKINGVRDRLKVLLVSGKPHAGGRTWRDLLTSDPGVDLVHFTILREPEKSDATPQRELALIAFPFRELFEIKLYDFDLIIFDRYRLNRILPQHYFRNIATYVKRGGALLEASGPSFASEDSIFYTDIGDILPARPDGEVISAVFKPQISERGYQHPVTESLNLYENQDGEPQWGSWLRQISLQPKSGDVLMTGTGEQPLLLLDRVGDGRVAQIGSDHIWLWSRGYEGGGPHAELLRRVVHWLMKEPELDEKALDIHVENTEIRIRSRDQNVQNLPITMVKPDGSRENMMLERDETGFLQTNIKAEQLGIYAFSDDTGQRRFAIIGDNNPPELRDVLTTEDHLAPMIQMTRGGALWLEEVQKPNIRYLSNASNLAGRNWVAFRNNNDFSIKSVKSAPILPAWAWFALLSAVLLCMWWREGRG